MAEFSKPEYRVDVLKVGVPVNMAFVEGSPAAETFQYALELAAEAGVNFSGGLCGRATWKDGVTVFVDKGLTALEDWLHSEGVRNVKNVNQHLGSAQPWFSMNQESHLEKR
jgi:tagatose 1,6-diphosphate aldolase